MREATDDYCGNMEGGIVFTCERPFVLMDWPDERSCRSFETEKEARHFIAKAKTIDPFVAFSPLYGFSGGMWNRI
jgi:hypothetical protein